MTRSLTTRTTLLLLTLLGATSCAKQRAVTPVDNISQLIIAQERRALDRWSQGDPKGYAQNAADDVTYFDDIAASTRVDGLEEWRGYLSSLDTKIPPHRYEIADPKVQVYGDVGILTLRYHAFALDGKPLTKWKATSVYRRSAGEWRVVHAHWSTVKDQ